MGMEAYRAWADRHATVFSLRTQADMQMMVEWVTLLADAGYAPAELEEATSWLATHAPPARTWDHLPALVERLKAQRSRGSEPPEDPRGECTLCRRTGRVIVPRPESDPCGRWYTWAVLCRCALGRWYGERQASRNPLTLDAYEAQVPHWRRLVEQHAGFLADLERQRRRDLERQGKGGGNRAWDELVARILKRERDR